MARAVRRTNVETPAPAQRQYNAGAAAEAIQHEPVRGPVQKATSIRAQMLAWQKELNFVSGSIVIAYGGVSLKKTELDGWKFRLRAVLQQMEGH